MSVVLALIVFGTATAGRVALPLKPDPFARTLGWHDVADATRAELAGCRGRASPTRAVLSDDRAVTAELLYYMRRRADADPRLAPGRPARSLRADASVHRRNALVRCCSCVPTTSGGPAVRLRSPASDKVGDEMLPAGRNAQRHVTFYALAGYKGQ